MWSSQGTDSEENDCNDSDWMRGNEETTEDDLTEDEHDDENSPSHVQ